MVDPRWAEIRRSYGDVYITVFPDGLTVPWKPLSVGDFMRYDQQFIRMLVPTGCLENEIFALAVQDRFLIDQIDNLPAGVVTVVANHIWQFSGPFTPDRFLGIL